MENGDGRAGEGVKEMGKGRGGDRRGRKRKREEREELT